MTETTKRLQRSADDRWIGGVCGGVAEYTGVDANLIRLLTAVGTLLGLGSLIVAYVVAWVIMPKELPPSATTIVREPPPPST